MAKQNTKERALLSQLLNDSKLYTSGKEFKELLEFINRLPNFAPFNAMLLQIQKKGLRFAASESDWKTKFNRTINEGARPLIILWPFAPVALVYDVDDTEGDKLPENIAKAFKATGEMPASKFNVFTKLLARKGIELKLIEYGEAHAGHIAKPIAINLQSTDVKQKPDYQIRINEVHEPKVQFATLTHELAHLFLGHLGMDKFLSIPDRQNLDHSTEELEAESVCYIVCHRNGVKPDSEAYLSSFVSDNMSVDKLDLYALLKAAGQIETILGLTVHTSFNNTTPYQCELQ